LAHHKNRSWAVIVAAILLLLGIAFPAPAFYALYQAPPGTAIRPMGETMVILPGRHRHAARRVPVCTPRLELGRRRALDGVDHWTTFGVRAPGLPFLLQWIASVRHLALEP
jgi:hypothetical protein